MLGKLSIILVAKDGRGVIDVEEAVCLQPYERFFNEENQKHYKNFVLNVGEDIFEEKVECFTEDRIKMKKLHRVDRAETADKWQAMIV